MPPLVSAQTWRCPQPPFGVNLFRACSVNTRLCQCIFFEPLFVKLLVQFWGRCPRALSLSTCRPHLALWAEEGVLLEEGLGCCLQTRGSHSSYPRPHPTGLLLARCVSPAPPQCRLHSSFPETHQTSRPCLPGPSSSVLCAQSPDPRKLERVNGKRTHT